MARAFSQKTPEQTLQELNTSSAGLTNNEAKKRILEYGYNEIKKGKGTGPIQLFFNQFKSVMIWILIGAALIAASQGEVVDAIAIFVILVINAVFGFLQEYKAEKSIEALQKLASYKAVVLRDGKEQLIDSRELVPGDILLLETGTKISTDARLIEVINFKTQEGALTGESLGVEKVISTFDKEMPLGDQRNMVFSGTIVTHGRAKAIVCTTGMHTEIGKIAGLISESKKEMTPLQKKLDKLGKRLGLATIIICVIVFLTGLLRGGEINEMFLAAVSLAVAAIPEGLAAVVTISLGIGVRKMIKKNALIRKLPSVETLGAVTVICTDKTGTLTHNEMTVTHLYCDEKESAVSGSGYAPEGKIEGTLPPVLFHIGALCNNAKLIKENNEFGVIGDPTEGCLLTVARKAGLDELALKEQFPRIDELEFDSTRKLMTTFHKVRGTYTSYTKGAPDQLVKNCDRILIKGKVRKITATDKKKILAQNKKFSEQALRVLGFAYNTAQKGSQAEKNMIFVGLQAMIDPPRDEVKKSIEECRSAGIRVVMITGDHLITASAIAKELGITGKAVEGSDIAHMDLHKEVEHIGVFARVNPEHKLAIVQALKKNGHVVAMTGDGINDAPALKTADIGVAMGITGTDVAKEASSMILTDDNFSSIVSAVEEGRNIYDNIKKFVNYLLSSNMGEVLILFIAMIIGFQYAGETVLPLIPIHLLWINIITDGLPALALGVDPPSKNIMKRTPRNPKSSIVTKNMAWNIVIIGILMTIAVLTVFSYYLPLHGVEKAQTMALSILVVLEIVRLAMIRSQYHTPLFSNKWLTMAIVGVIILQLLVIYSPLNVIFHLTPLALMDWVFIVMISVAMMVIGTFASLMIRKQTHQSD